MGQRLVVTIKANDEPKMKIYYHWSGYTGSTFDVLNDLWFNAIKPLKEAHKDTNEILLGIIRYLEGNVDEHFREWLKSNNMSKIYGGKLPSCHGGVGWFNKESKLGSDEKLPNTELEYIQSLYPGETFSEDVDRNNGLVYMSEDGMADAQMWSEGDASIDLATDEIRNDVHWVYDDWVNDILYERNGEDFDDDEKKKTEQEYALMSTYDGDGIDVFVCKGDKIKDCWETWDDLVGNGYRFKDKHGIVWEGLA